MHSLKIKILVLNMPAIAKLDKLSVHRAGIFVVVEAPGLGLQVKWDRGTRVYVKLKAMWKGNVQGLCGNFNGDVQDDLKTPSSGIETSAIIFGDSWKLQDFCASKLDIVQLRVRKHLYSPFYKNQRNRSILAKSIHNGRHGLKDNVEY